MKHAYGKRSKGLRRPLAVAGFSLFSALLLLSFFGSAKGAAAAAVVCGICFLSGLGLFFKKRSVRLCVVSGAALAGCLLFLCASFFVAAPALRQTGENVEVSALVTGFPSRSANGKRVYLTAHITANGTRVPGKVRLSLPAGETRNCDFAAALCPGDRVSFCGTVYALGGENSAVRRSFQSRRFFLGAFPTKKAERILPSRAPLWARFLSLRQAAVSALHSRFPGDAGGVLISLMFGDKTYLSFETYRAFRDAGAAHLLAVSGLHLSVWVLGLLVFLRRRGVRREASAAVCIGVTLLVMASALFAASVLRAGFMLLLYLLGFLLRRDSDGLNSLGFAVIVCLLLDPFLAANAGFLLSVLSTAALFLLAFPLQKKLMSGVKQGNARQRRLLGVLCTGVSTSLCVTVVTAPVLIYYFKMVSLVGVLTNLLFLPLATPLLLCAGLSTLFGGVPLLGTAVCTLTKLLSLLAIRIVRLFSSLPFAVFSAEKIHAVPALVCSFCLCALLLLLLSGKRNSGKRRLCVLLSVLFFSVAAVSAAAESGTARLVMLQAGQGSCVFLRRGNDAVLLRFACGTYEADLAMDALEESGVRLRAVVLNGSANDNALCKRLSPEHVILREQGKTAQEEAFSFGEFRVQCLQNGVLVSGRGNRFFLSDNNTLALSSFSGIIHTDAAASPLSAAKDTLILTAAKNGALRLRGENDWHTLMKSSSKPT